MKVHEIITESQILTENLSRVLLNVLERVGVADFDRALAYLARSVVGKTDVAVGKEMAEAWLAASKKTGLPFEDVVAAGQRELNTAGVNRTVVDAALAEAERIAPGLWSRIMSRLGKAGTKAEHEAAAKSIFGSKFDFVSALAYKLAIWGPVAECAYHLIDLKRRRDSGDPEYQNDATYVYCIHNLQGDEPMKSMYNMLKVYLGFSDKYCAYCGGDRVIPHGYYILECKDCNKETHFEFGHAGIDGYNFKTENKQ